MTALLPCLLVFLRCLDLELGECLLGSGRQSSSRITFLRFCFHFIGQVHALATSLDLSPLNLRVVLEYVKASVFAKSGTFTDGIFLRNKLHRFCLLLASLDRHAQICLYGQILAGVVRISNVEMVKMMRARLPVTTFFSPQIACRRTRRVKKVGVGTQIVRVACRGTLRLGLLFAFPLFAVDRRRNPTLADWARMASDPFGITCRFGGGRICRRMGWDIRRRKSRLRGWLNTSDVQMIQVVGAGFPVTTLFRPQIACRRVRRVK